jgi:hypothetical protein
MKRRKLKYFGGLKSFTRKRLNFFFGSQVLIKFLQESKETQALAGSARDGRRLNSLGFH